MVDMVGLELMILKAFCSLQGSGILFLCAASCSPQHLLVLPHSLSCLSYPSSGAGLAQGSSGCSTSFSAHTKKVGK